MRARTITTGITLLVLCALLGVGLWVGVEKLFAPVEKAAPTVQPTETCRTLAKGKTLKSRQVTVNVLNGGTRGGLAGNTLDALAQRGFTPGEIGNRPQTKVRRVQVWIVKGEEAAGRLVALNFGPKTPVVRHKDVTEGGVDIVVADGFDTLAKARRQITLRQRTEVCKPIEADPVG